MKRQLSQQWREFASGQNCSLLWTILLCLLIPLSMVYGVIMRLRWAGYKSGLLKSRRLERPVISIGNITVGGTGKTPVTIQIARFLIDHGFKVAVLSRGYGGSLEGEIAIVSDGEQIILTAEESGDEPYLLASSIPGLIVVIGSDRYSAGQLAISKFSPDIFLLDDGFQHLRLQRDLDILLLDHARPLGNGWTLPAGILREPKAALARAGITIQTRTPKTYSGQNLISVSYCLKSARPLNGGEAIELKELQNRRVFAFAGIAEPEQFFDELRSTGINIVGTLHLPDHQAYTNQIAEEISRQLELSAAELAITTEKDGVKLSGCPTRLSELIMLAPLELQIKNQPLLEQKILNLLQK